MTDELTFGWVSPVIGLPDSDNEPIVMYQERNILPTAFEHFDCVWLADTSTDSPTRTTRSWSRGRR